MLKDMGRLSQLPTLGRCLRIAQMGAFRYNTEVNFVMERFLSRSCWSARSQQGWVTCVARRGDSGYLQHGGENPLVATEREEVVEVHSRVDDSGSILPEESTVFGVENQSPIKHIEKKHDLVSPGKLARHAQEHFLQELDPQAFLKGVKAKQFLPSCENMKQQRLH